MWIYFWALNCVLFIYLSDFMLITYSFYYYSFAIWFGIRRCDAFSVLSKDWFGCSIGGSVKKYSIFFYFCKKSLWNFDRDCIKSMFSVIWYIGVTQLVSGLLWEGIDLCVDVYFVHLWGENSGVSKVLSWWHYSFQTYSFIVVSHFIISS